MKTTHLAAIFALAALTVSAQDNSGSIKGRVILLGTTDGIAGAQITLEGPMSSTLDGRYTPSPALTPAMREEIDALIASSPFGYALELAAVNAKRREALLLGLPDPGPSPVTTRTPPRQLNTQTDASGNFSFQGVEPGRYRVRAMREGHFGALRSDGLYTTDAITAVNVVAGQSLPAMSFALARGGAISGTARGANGQPVPSVSVRVYRLAYDNGAALLQTAGNQQQTNDRGDYRIFNLPPGEYYVGVFIGLSIGGGRPQDAYATTFHAGTTDAKNARRITMNGSEITGIDIDVQRKPATVISGRVDNLPALDILGRPQTASTFFVLPADPKALTENFVTFLSSATDRSNGQFEIRGVVPGTYNLLACTNDNTGRVFEGRTRIDVATEDLRSVAINMQPAVDMRARVTVDAAAPPYTMGPPPPPNRDSPPPPNQPPIPRPSIQLFMASLEPYAGVLRGDLPAECRSAAGMRGPMQTTFDPTGLYTFPNIPAGRHVIQVTGLPKNAYVADMRMDGVSVLDGFDVGSQPGEVAVTIRTNGATVEGTVRDAQRSSRVATVVLVPQRARRNASLYRSVVSDSTGRFTLSGVAPGEYRVFAWESVPTNAWTNAEFLARYEDQGKPIIVNAGTTGTIDVQPAR